MISGVVFDLGSTLIRFNGSWPEAFERACVTMADFMQSQGLSFDREAFLQAFLQEMEARDKQQQVDHIEQTTSAIFRQVMSQFGYSKLSPELVRKAMKKLFTVMETYWQPMPGVHRVLNRLRDEGYRLGLISNAGDAADVYKLIYNARLGGYFDPVVISAEVGFRKPDRRIYEVLLQAWGLPPQNLVMIGDRLEQDILGAQMAGMHQIWLIAEKKLDRDFSGEDEIVPEIVAEKLEWLPRLIRQI